MLVDVTLASPMSLKVPLPHNNKVPAPHGEVPAPHSEVPAPHSRMCDVRNAGSFDTVPLP